MRQIDNMTPEEIHTLELKGMIASQVQKNIAAANKRDNAAYAKAEREAVARREAPQPTPQPQGFMHPQTDEELYWQACWTEQKRETEDVRQQRDELLAVTKRLCDSLDRNEILIPPDALRILSETEAAIARAEKGQS